jgi:hypothetical protein
MVNYYLFSPLAAARAQKLCHPDGDVVSSVFFSSVFPQRPVSQGRTVVAFHNQVRRFASQNVVLPKYPNCSALQFQKTTPSFELLFVKIYAKYL